MGTKRYTDTFKLEAVREVTEGGHELLRVLALIARLGLEIMRSTLRL